MFPNWNTRLISVVGEPLQLPHIAQPTREQINEWHQKYITAIQELFDKNKQKYAMQGKDAVLELF